MKGFMKGLAATALAVATVPAGAGYCDYCDTGGQGEWQCRQTHVIFNGISFFTGSVCTYFYSSSSGYNPGSEWSDYWDRNYGSNGRFRYFADYIISNYPDNTIPATCTSDVNQRWLHANRDVALRNAAAGTLGLTPTHSLVQVSYNDGSIEVWKVVSPLSSTPLFDVPMQGTKKCAQ